MKKKNKKNGSVSSKIIILYIVGLLVVIFLSLPLIFQDKTNPAKQTKQKQETLPLKTENPFTHYFNLFKKFYSPNKKKGQASFSQIKNNLQVKNTLTKKGSQQALAPKNIEGILGLQTPVSDRNYYDEKGTIQYAQEEVYPETYDPSQEIKESPVKQEPFEDFLMEGLYETSQLDPYETKLAARKKMLDIISPNPFVFLTPGKNLEQPLAKATASKYIKENSPQQEEQSILFNDGTNTNRVSASASKYLNRIMNPFYSNNAIADKLDINGLPFETQAGLVSSRLNTIYINNQTNSNSNNNSQNGQNNQGGQDNPNPEPPFPPKPPQNTFDPTKWDPQIDVACSAPDEVAVQEDINQPKSAQQQETQEENSDKIEHCDQELQDKLPKVNNNMQKNYNYLLVSGRYNGKIMIPAYNSLSDTILTFGIQSDDFNFLNYPEQLQGKKFSQNTKPTNFQFVVDLNPQIFNQMLQDEKTILISVDPEDQKRFPQKTILIQSGEIETFSGVTRIVDEINHFKQKQEKLKKLAQEQEKMEKEQMAENLKDKINATL
ncbi:MAG: hypothetical protein IKP23_02920 [Elusimicrobiaceae bacterium]|nr:hypothetical protein [Elusimicrobiaceae bacterium]